MPDDLLAPDDLLTEFFVRTNFGRSPDTGRCSQGRGLPGTTIFLALFQEPIAVSMEFSVVGFIAEWFQLTKFKMDLED